VAKPSLSTSARRTEFGSDTTTDSERFQKCAVLLRHPAERQGDVRQLKQPDRSGHRLSRQRRRPGYHAAVSGSVGPRGTSAVDCNEQLWST